MFVLLTWIYIKCLLLKKKQIHISYFLFPELVILLRVRGSHIEYRHESKPVAVKLAVHHFCIVGINTVLKAFPWKKGDEILATTHTYCSIQNACRKAAEFSTGVKYVESVKCQSFLLCALVRIKKIHVFINFISLWNSGTVYICFCFMYKIRRTHPSIWDQLPHQGRRGNCQKHDVSFRWTS